MPTALNPLSLTISSPQAMHQLGQALAQALAQAAGSAVASAEWPEVLWLFSGPMAAGKTTLIKALCAGLGVPPHQVISPTYTLVNIYPLPAGAAAGLGQQVVHVDLFRLEATEMLLDMDRNDWINPEGLTLVEWPEVALPLLNQDPWVWLELAPGTDENERKLQIKTNPAQAPHPTTAAVWQVLEAFVNPPPPHTGE